MSYRRAGLNSGCALAVLHCTRILLIFVHFVFIKSLLPQQDMRCRTTFYTALGRLLMVDLGEDEERFENFMIPLTNAFDAIGRVMSSKADLELVGNQEVRLCV